MNKLLNIAYGSFIAIVVYLALCLLFGGCGQAPESFHIVECQRTPGDLYVYDCQTSGYSRCLDLQGNAKYSECDYNGVFCVAKCP